MKDKLGLLECCVLLVGTMVGSAIFSLSGLSISMAGATALLSWILGGFIMLMHGLCMGELACRFPDSGGTYVFPRRAFSGKLGQRLAWLCAWASMLTNIIAVAFSAIYVGVYLSTFISAADGLRIPLALGAILLCLLLNIIKFRTAGRINSFVVTLLILTLLLYAGLCFHNPAYKARQAVDVLAEGGKSLMAMFSTVPITIIAYSGIVSLAFVASNVRDPRRTIPRAMLISIIVVEVLYCLVLLGTLGLVSSSYLHEHPEACFMPLFTACKAPWQMAIVGISGVLALLSTMLICITMTAWGLHAAAQDGMLPAWLGQLNKSEVPARPALLCCLAAMALACFPQATSSIINLGAILNTLSIAITLLSLIQARKSPNPAIFHAPGGTPMPWIVLAILILCNLPGINSGGWKIWCFTAALLAIGSLVPRKK